MDFERKRKQRKQKENKEDKIDKKCTVRAARENKKVSLTSSNTHVYTTTKKGKKRNLLPRTYNIQHT